jgi:hypothetical protein
MSTADPAYVKARDRAEAVRNGRAAATVLAIDLSRTTEAIHRDLRARWPRVIDLWWELDEGDAGDEKSGFVFDGNKILARLVHCN